MLVHQRVNLEECPIMSKLILKTFSWFGIWPCQPYTPNVMWLWYEIYHGGGTNHDFFSVGIHVIIVTTAIYHNDPQWTWVIAMVFQMVGGGHSIQSIGQCEVQVGKCARYISAHHINLLKSSQTESSWVPVHFDTFNHFAHKFLETCWISGHSVDSCGSQIDWFQATLGTCAMLCSRDHVENHAASGKWCAGG